MKNIKYTTHPLQKFFSGYFDTSVGLKTESESYRNIAKQINKENDTNSILFVTDNINGKFLWGRSQVKEERFF